MDEKELKQGKISPINQYVLCEGKQVKSSPIELPDMETVSTAYKVLVVKYAAEDCKEVKINDIIFIGPMAKTLGTIDFNEIRYAMVKETDVAFIVRRGKGKKDA